MGKIVEKLLEKDNVIELYNVCKTYKIPSKCKGLGNSFRNFFKKKYIETKALNNVNLTVKKKDIVGIIGPNGAGKTTLIKVITGLLYPEPGSIVKVFGENPFKKDIKNLKKISFISGLKNQLNWDLTAMDSFLLNKAIYSVEIEKFEYVVNNLAKKLNVFDLLNIPVRNVSLGQRMKLELICALIHSPELIFLDEPTIGLDYDSQNNIRDFLKDYNKSNGATIIITSHNLEDIKKLCNKIVYINKGDIKYLGSSSFLEDQRISNHKILEIVCYSKDIIDKLIDEDYGKTLRKTEFKISIAIEVKNISAIIHDLFEKFDIQDINILENDIQYLVEELYYKTTATENNRG